MIPCSIRRFCAVFSPEGIDNYYALCRGASALEMTKWFDTNYLYLITDLSGSPHVHFRCNFNHLALKIKM